MNVLDLLSVRNISENARYNFFSVAFSWSTGLGMRCVCREFFAIGCVHSVVKNVSLKCVPLFLVNIFNILPYGPMRLGNNIYVTFEIVI